MSKQAANWLSVRFNVASSNHRHPSVTGFMGLHFLFISASQALAFASCWSFLLLQFLSYVEKVSIRYKPSGKLNLTFLFFQTYLFSLVKISCKPWVNITDTTKEGGHNFEMTSWVMSSSFLIAGHLQLLVERADCQLLMTGMKDY